VVVYFKTAVGELLSAADRFSAVSAGFEPGPRYRAPPRATTTWPHFGGTPTKSPNCIRVMNR